MIASIIYFAAAVLGLILAFMPWMIYNELKRQGEARRDEALKIISLLVRISGTGCDRNADDITGIQAAIDAKNAKGISE